MTTVADPDYWSLLGLEPGSDADKLKQAFRREARRWHPDLNGNDPIAEVRFKLVNEAYAVLSDPRRRAAWQSGDGPAAEQQQDPFAEGFPGFEDYLDVVLGRVETDQNQRTPTPEPPVPSPAGPPPVRALDDLESVVDLSPDQALYGTSVELSLEDGTLVQLDTPPNAGDGWRLRL